jgi:hypothetical protein
MAMKKELFSLLGALALASCGASSTLIIEQPQQVRYEPQAVPASFTIRSAAPGDDVPQESIAAFEKRVRTKLERAGVTGLLIEYHFIRTGTDEQLDRWFTGGSGRRSVTVDVIFKNANAERLARIQAEGRYEPGLFGGSLQSALNRAADEVAAYAIETFGN